MKNKPQTKFTLALLPLLLLSSYSPQSFAASEYVKDIKTGCKVYDLDDAKYSASWSGACVNGKVSGKGTLTTTDKKTNVSCENKGEMQAGLRTGHTVADCSDGTHFEGDYKPVAGVVNGKGTLKFPDGGKYVGEVKGWTIHGQGTITAANGQIVSGTFDNNKLVQGDAGAGTASNKALDEMMGLVTKSASLAQQNPAEATALLNQFLSTYTQLPKEVYTSSDFQGLVSTALYSKGVALLVQDKKDEYLALYDEFSAHYEKLPQQVKESPEAQLRMAGLTYSKGWLLDKHGEIDKGIASWDENNRRFGKSTDPAMKKVVADGLSSKASINDLKANQAKLAKLEKTLADINHNWAKDPKTGCEVWVTNDVLNKEDGEISNAKSSDYGVTWDGPCVDGKAHGKGVATYRGAIRATYIHNNCDDAHFINQYSHLHADAFGVEHPDICLHKAKGHGGFQSLREYFPDPTNINTYKGELKNGKADGYGEVTTRLDGKAGGGIKAMFKDGEMDGQCVLISPSGNRLEGNCNKRGLQGEGVEKYADGSVYKGNFLNNQLSGYGEKLGAKGKVIYAGQWLIGLPIAEAEKVIEIRRKTDELVLESMRRGAEDARRGAESAQRDLDEFHQKRAAEENRANQDAANRAWANNPMNPANGHMRGR